MKQSLNILLVITLLLPFYSCDECRNTLNEREALGIWLNFENKNTQQNLFHGDGKIYEKEDFQMFIESTADTLVRVSEQNLQFDEGVIYKHLTKFSTDISGDFITTLYYRLEENQPLDTIDIQYNEIEYECIGTFKENYDIFLNGEIICEDCSHQDVITIYK